MEVCCDAFQEFFSDQRVPLFYDSTTRSVFLNIDLYGGIGLNFCPWCGHKFKPHLGREYYDILEKEYEISVLDVSDGKIPDEFKSDAWWKKRGL